MATIYTIEVEFDPSNNNGFTFSGVDLVAGPLGQRLNVPFTTDPNDPPEIHIKKKPVLPPPTWNFKTISFRGPTGSSLILVDSWRTVTQDDEIFPVKFVDDPTTMILEVLSFDANEIVIQDTNLATQLDIGIRLQITIFDTSEGKSWTSPDPQIINEKEGEGA